MYEQRIRYLSLREGEERKSVGFVKLACWGGMGSIVVQITGLDRWENGEREILLAGENGEFRRIGCVVLTEGRGRAELKGLKSGDIAGSSYSFAEVAYLSIPLSDDKEILCRLREAGETFRLQAGAQRDGAGLPMRAEHMPDGGDLQGPSEGAPGEKNLAGSKEGAPGEKNLQGPSEGAPGEKDPLEPSEGAPGAKEPLEPSEGTPGAKEPLEPSEGTPGAKDLAEREEEARQGEILQKAAKNRFLGEEPPGRAERGVRGEEPPGQASKGKKSLARAGRKPVTAASGLKAGKWEQLTVIYPHIAPFGDGRKYLQIGLGDFVILKDRSYRKVNNSFLLHGYFTYKHLILHRVLQKGEAVYYVGVPGHFFDKEKEVALLFGFECFEGETEPAKEGEYGYYMMRVEL